MATRKQKQKLIDTLKFTPIKVRVLIQGYGGETYMGTVPRKTYEFFKKHRIDIEQYVNDWDDGDRWSFVPEEMRFVSPGQAYDCDGLFHESGATMDDGSYITIEDEQGNTIFESNLDVTDLVNQGVNVVLREDVDTDEMEPGTVIFWGGQGEKGCFFDAELTLRAPFDPTKLTVFYSDGDGWRISGGAEYDGEDLEGHDGYSTTGKWGEHKFYIVGGEEAYKGIERDEDGNMVEDEDDEKLDYDHPEANFDDTWDAADELDKITVPKFQWQPEGTDPPAPGEYDVLIDAPWPMGGPGRAEWTGSAWQQGEKEIAVSQWGYAEDPLDIPVLENEETWASRVIDESQLSPWWHGDQKPVRKGEYEVFEKDSGWPFPQRAQWTGRAWKVDDETIQVREWRGLNHPPE